MKKRYICILGALLLLASSPAIAQGRMLTEQKFHDLFITAGYSTAFGAALGGAFIGLTSDPARHLKYIGVGASLGFIGGSILGSYLAFSPMFVSTATKPGDLTAGAKHPITLEPSWNIAENSLSGFRAKWLVASF